MTASPLDRNALGDGGGVLASGVRESGREQGAGNRAGRLRDSGSRAGDLFVGETHVMAVADAAGDVAGEYRYGPYGQTRTAAETGIANPFRFSTKFLETAFASENETLSFGSGLDLYDYGFRWYHAGLGRWTARDPIGERGGMNGYRSLHNNTAEYVDVYGLFVDVTQIPGIMVANSYVIGASFQTKWLSADANYPNPDDTSTVTMAWVLGFKRARDVYDEIMNKKLYINKAARSVIKKKYTTLGRFGDLSQPVPLLNKDYIQHRLVKSDWKSDPIDDLFCALGNFTFRVVISGCVLSDVIAITHVGVYVHDEFSFDGAQVLGYWNATTNYAGRNPNMGVLVTNKDYRFYRDLNQRGVDFQIFSDLKVTRFYPAIQVR